MPRLEVCTRAAGSVLRESLGLKSTEGIDLSEKRDRGSLKMCGGMDGRLHRIQCFLEEEGKSGRGCVEVQIYQWRERGKIAAFECSLC